MVASATSPKMPKLHHAFDAARPSLARARSAVSVGGMVLGISSTAVTPPITAAREPLAQSSLWVSPGSRKWT